MMTRKTQKAYEHALRYVHENVFPLQCEAMITDYEIAMRKAVREVIPGIKQLGCWFHYAQAIRRKIASLSELFELVRTNDKIRNIYYKIICLALLPHDKIEKAFNELALEGLQLTKSFMPFVKYFQNQWLKRVGAKNFSVFLEETRTTCSAEGYNGKLGKKFRTHPNFFVFIESLQWEELAKSNALEQHINGARQTQPKKEYRERAAQIRNESLKFLIPNKIDAKLFLNRIANTKNRMLPTEFERFEDIVAYVDETEELLEDMCIDTTVNHTKTTTSKPDNDTKISKKLQNLNQPEQQKKDTAVAERIKDKTNTKIPKKSQNTNQTQQQKADRTADRTKDNTSKPDNNLNIAKQSKEACKRTSRSCVTTRSQSKRLISNGQS